MGEAISSAILKVQDFYVYLMQNNTNWFERFSEQIGNQVKRRQALQREWELKTALKGEKMAHM